MCGVWCIVAVVAAVFTVLQVIKNMCSFTLSTDGRVCDDELAIRWLVAFKKFMENPITML